MPSYHVSAGGGGPPRQTVPRVFEGVEHDRRGAEHDEPTAQPQPSGAAYGEGSNVGCVDGSQFGGLAAIASSRSAYGD
jgi:hypothetical protein